jgi:hypothetical protein
MSKCSTLDGFGSKTITLGCKHHPTPSHKTCGKFYRLIIHLLKKYRLGQSVNTHIFEAVLKLHKDISYEQVVFVHLPKIKKLE